MANITITPWRKQADLLKVRDQLYEQHDDNDVLSGGHEEAVERVMAWKLRGNLPHAVESTALLVDATFHHKNAANSAFSVRAVYSAAFCRFVTGFCDIGRHKERTLEPSSMLDIAKQIGMPEQFVALRHEATHEELPGLQRLVSATQEALDWLWKVYWSRLQETKKLQRVQTSDNVVETLREYRRCRRDEIRNMRENQADYAMEALDHALRGDEYDLDAIKRVAQALVEERLIFPSNREPGSQLQGAYLIWDDFLMDLASRFDGFLDTFVECLLMKLSQPPLVDPKADLDKEAAYMWLLHFWEGASMETTRWKPEQALSFEKRVMRWCCMHPGPWTGRLGEEMLEKGGDGDLRRDWEDLFRASSINAAHEGIGVEGREDERIDDDGPVGPWTRAVISTSTPIGVV